MNYLIKDINEELWLLVAITQSARNVRTQNSTEEKSNWSQGSTSNVIWLP